jgi:peptidoglycan hydrolase-like protein with peptidoglycan-binding domain
MAIRVRSSWAGLVAMGLVAVGALSGCSVPGANDPADAAGETTPPATAKVQRTDLTETATESGQLGYGDPLDLPSSLTGTVTWLPTVGTVVPNGEPLYRLDADPVLRLDGKVPAWRDLDPDVTSGRDVLQLERALTDLGYTDDLDMEVDGDWTWVTTIAVERWQRHHGLDDDGELPLGRVVFTDGDVRVASESVEDGTPVQPGTVVLQVGATQRTVTVSVDPTQKRLAPVHQAVDLEFPDGTTARGRIREVDYVPGNEAEQTDESLTVTIEVVGPPSKRKEVDKQLDGTSVQVGFSHTIAKDVLAVPVTALVALVAGGYGVEKVGDDGKRSYVAVSTGSFSETLVEVDSPDLAEGDEVVVTP